MEIKIEQIPMKVRMVALSLQMSNFEAYFVGGCVRDLLLGRVPHDWDICTSATPEQIISLFSHTFYENDYGTVGVVLDSDIEESKQSEVASGESLGKESKYSNIVEVPHLEGRGNIVIVGIQIKYSGSKT